MIISESVKRENDLVLRRVGDNKAIIEYSNVEHLCEGEFVNITSIREAYKVVVMENING